MILLISFIGIIALSCWLFCGYLHFQSELHSALAEKQFMFWTKRVRVAKSLPVAIPEYKPYRWQYDESDNQDVIKPTTSLRVPINERVIRKELRVGPGGVPNTYSLIERIELNDTRPAFPRNMYISDSMVRTISLDNPCDCSTCGEQYF